MVGTRGIQDSIAGAEAPEAQSYSISRHCQAQGWPFQSNECTEEAGREAGLSLVTGLQSAHAPLSPRLAQEFASRCFPPKRIVPAQEASGMRSAPRYGRSGSGTRTLPSAC
jgi:hypothetical protein